jgi:hypothetical protein
MYIKDYLLREGRVFQTTEDITFNWGTKVRSGTVIAVNRWANYDILVPKLFTNITTAKDRVRTPGSCVWLRFSMDMFFSPSVKNITLKTNFGHDVDGAIAAQASLHAHLLGLIRNKHK